MLARTKDIGSGGFRAQPADGALPALGGASPSPRGEGPGAAPVVAGLGPASRCANSFPDPGRCVVVVRRQEPAVRARRAGLTLCQRHPCTWRLSQAGTTPSQLITAAEDADRDHIGDAVEAQRGQARTAVAGPRRSAGRKRQRRASRACARRRRRSCRRRPSVPPPRAARQCRAGVVHGSRPPSLSSSVPESPLRRIPRQLAHHAPGMTRHDGVGLRSML